MQGKSFLEKDVYYQYEWVEWNDHKVPVLSDWVCTWTPVSKDTVNDVQTSQGYTFSFLCFDWGWKVSEVTQIFPSYEEASLKMKTWEELCAWMLAIEHGGLEQVARSDHGQMSAFCQSSDLIPMDGYYYSVNDNDEEPKKHELYYTGGFIEWDERRALPSVETQVCNGKSTCCKRAAKEGEDCSLWEFSTVLSRNGVLERFGKPRTGTPDAFGKRWNAWRASVRNFIQSADMLRRG